MFCVESMDRDTLERTPRIHVEIDAGHVARFVRGEIKTASALSCGSFRQRRAFIDYFFATVASSHSFCTRGVSVVPGDTQLTVMPSGPSCFARCFVNVITPPFDVA